MNVAISLLSSLITFTFAAMMLDQYFVRRRPYQAVWAIALVVFGLGVFVEFLANLFGWTVATYRWWFLFGATFAAATLGLGTVYLLLPLRIARRVTGVLLLTGAWATYRVLTVPIDAAAVVPLHGQATPPSVQAIPADVTIIVVLFNTLGTIAVIGGALWSAWRYRRQGTAAYRVASNLLIALGALIVAASGSLAGLGNTAYLFIGELAGITVIFFGFLRSQASLTRTSLPLLHRLGKSQRSSRSADQKLAGS
jgi:hypothetical protein